VSDYDVFLADCPARTTLEVVGHTWSVVVVVALGDGPLRYGELLDRIGGISNKMLTQTLARLRGNGLLTSTDGLHTLTDLGRSLLTPVRALADWAEQHTGDLLDARRAAHAPDPTPRTEPRREPPHHELPPESRSQPEPLDVRRHTLDARQRAVGTRVAR
jgi:DNA-binding HxlR family transcriptional regulator